MTRTVHLLTMFSLAAAGSPLDAASPAKLHGGAGGRLTILVENLAGAAPRLANGAIETAREILEDAGVEANWIVCPRGGDRPAACSARPGPWTLRLRLISEAKARLLPLTKNNFGVALPGTDGALGSLAYVFVERTQRHAKRIKVADTVLVGHMMAHELGHLLLGESSHAASGIMTARFKARHLQKVGQGGVRFLGKQARAMRAQTQRRLASRPGAAAAD